MRGVPRSYVLRHVIVSHVAQAASWPIVCVPRIVRQVDCIDRKMLTPLLMCVQRGRADWIRKLAVAGAATTLPDISGAVRAGGREVS